MKAASLTARSTTARPADSQALTGRSFLGWLLAAFAIVAAVNIVMVYFAIQSFSGETEAKSYAAGLDFNRTLARVDDQKLLGWRLIGGVTHRGDGAMDIDVGFIDANGQPIDGLQVNANFIRPTNSGVDFELPVTSRGSGRYAVSATPPLPGRWHVRVSAAREGQLEFIADFDAPRPGRTRGP